MQQQLARINAQIKQLGFVGNISREFLDRHSALKGEIDALKNQNQAFLTQNELQAAKANADMILKRSIEDILNAKMKEFNDSLFTTKKKPTHVHFNAYNSYKFETPDNTGTGSNYKGMIVYDLCCLQLRFRLLPTIYCCLRILEKTLKLESDLLHSPSSPKTKM